MVIPLSFSLAVMTASWTCFPHIPLPPNLGSSDGCMFMILPSNASMIGEPMQHRNPARTMKSMDSSLSVYNIGWHSSHSLRENVTVFIPRDAMRVCTPASSRFDSTAFTRAISLLAKCLAIASAFEPSPDAKMAMFFTFL